MLLFFFSVHKKMTNTRGYDFWRINDVLTNSRWRWIDRSCEAGCVQERGEGNTKQYTFVLGTAKLNYMSKCAYETGWQTKENSLALEPLQIWGLSGHGRPFNHSAGRDPSPLACIMQIWGLTGHGQPFNHLAGRDPSPWACIIPSASPLSFFSPTAPWGPGSLVGLQGRQRPAGFFGPMTMVTFRNGLCSGHSQRCCRVPLYWGFLDWMGRNQRKFPTDCLYTPASKRRVRFWVESVAQDDCKPKKPHLFHGSSLYPQSQEIILLTEKAY